MKLLLEEKYTNPNTYYDNIFTSFHFIAIYELVTMVKLLLEWFDIRPNMLYFKEHIVLSYATKSNYSIESWFKNKVIKMLRLWYQVRVRYVFN